MKKSIIFALLALFVNALSAQVIWTEPAFPTQDDQVTLYYNAAEGNGNLTGVVPVYIHTGVITSESEGPNDWQNVVTQWGTTAGNAVMSPQGNNIHTFNFGGQTLAEFYGVGAGVSINSLAPLFAVSTTLYSPVPNPSKV